MSDSCVAGNVCDSDSNRLYRDVVFCTKYHKQLTLRDRKRDEFVNECYGHSLRHSNLFRVTPLRFSSISTDRSETKGGNSV